MRSIYMDYAATTYVKKEVLDEMLPFFADTFGNPSSAHAYGREARLAVNRSRQRIAAAINADEREIFFTSGGTESDNWAIKGAAYAGGRGKHIITTAVEHHAVLDSCEYLAQNGYDVTFLPVDENGLVAPEQVERAIRPDTALISVMTANNEIGAIEPIADIGRIARQNGVLFHTDAVQAAGSISLDVQELNVDLLALSAHKFYGPKGVGVLYIRKGAKVEKYMHGGAQERNRRATTENTPGIAGAGRALELAVSQMARESERLASLRDHMIKRIMSEIPQSKLNGHPQKRLPNNVNVSFAGIEGEALIVGLDMRGIAASSGSACMSGSFGPSYALMALGMDESAARSSVRFTLGASTTRQDADDTVDAVREIVKKLRHISPYYEL